MDGENNFMSPTNGGRSYLITYSNAIIEKFPTRESFANMVVSHFNQGTSKAKVEYFSCCQEFHSNGNRHYHVALKLTGVKKWLRVKESIQKAKGLVLNFGDKYDNYVAALRYVCKEDVEVYLSPGHPPLEEMKTPTTAKSTSAFRKKHRSGCGASASKKDDDGTPLIKKPAAPRAPKRISNLQVGEFILKHSISNLTEL